MATLHVPVSAADHIPGNPNAPVTLVEHADYECPCCGEAYPIVKRVQQHFGKRLHYVTLNGQQHDAAYDFDDLVLAIDARLRPAPPT